MQTRGDQSDPDPGTTHGPSAGAASEQGRGAANSGARRLTLNPFAGLDRPWRVWAWGMYDFANQSFTLLIITLLFPLYVKQVIVGPGAAGSEGGSNGGGAGGDLVWSLMQGSSLLLVVAVSPVVGAIADAGGLRKAFLIGTGVVCATLTATLGLAGAGMVWIAASIYIVANLCYQVGENFLASFLPDVSSPRNIGRVSATGWSMGYAGALVLLVLTAVGMEVFSLQQTEDWAPFFVFAGVWFALGMVPAIVLLHEPKRAEPRPALHVCVTSGFARLARTVRDARTYRQLVIFLAGFFVYALGVQTVIAFASILASDFGFAETQLVLFVAQITVTAGLAAVATAFFQERVGARNTILVYLVVWLASALGLLALTVAPDPWTGWLWVIGNGLGVGLGGIGTASRSLVGRFTPSDRTAEFFGLWGMVYKLAGAVGVLGFGVTREVLGKPGAMVLLCSFFVVGGLVMLGVNEVRGLRAAKRSERDTRRPPPPFPSGPTGIA